MKKKFYEKPTSKVYKLNHQSHLLAGSGQAGVQNYDYQEFFEE